MASNGPEPENSRLTKVKKYVRNFLELPAIKRFVFNLRLFCKMPSQYPSTMGQLSAFFTLVGSLYFLSLSWIAAIFCGIGVGLIVGFCVKLRNTSYEEFANDIALGVDTDRQNQAYDEGREAGKGWVPYLKSCAKTSWITEPKHYGAGLIEVIGEEQTKYLEQNSFKEFAL